MQTSGTEKLDPLRGSEVDLARPGRRRTTTGPRGRTPSHVIEAPVIVLVELLAAAEPRTLHSTFEDLISALPPDGTACLTVKPSVGRGDQQVQIGGARGLVQAL